MGVNTKAFERIMNNALIQAERVKCPIEEFHRGLVVMFHTLKDRLEMESIDPDDFDLDDSEEEVESHEDDADFDDVT
jgi:hypothetical protein